MSIDAWWPDGAQGDAFFEGRARDILTTAKEFAPVLLAEDRLEARIVERTLLAISSTPPRNQLENLRGVRAGGRMREAVRKSMKDEWTAGSPLYLLLDDLAGATLVAPWGWSHWGEPWVAVRSGEERSERIQQMEGVCIGFRPGSSALAPDRPTGPEGRNSVPVGPLPHPDDPAGWHELAERDGVNFRRARRIDVWREDGLIRIDSAFQDSSSMPDGLRRAIHEYGVTATADENGRLLALAADPRILPLPECPAAPANLFGLVGCDLRDLRDRVLEVLRKTAGCTHLNDAVRAFAEVPQLVARLPGGH